VAEVKTGLIIFLLFAMPVGIAMANNNKFSDFVKNKIAELSKKLFGE